MPIKAIPLSEESFIKEITSMTGVSDVKYSFQISFGNKQNLVLKV